MSKSLTKHASLMILVIFVMSIGRVSADRFIHDLQHENNISHEVTLHHHDVGDIDDDHDDNSVVFNEHQMLHAIDLIQFFPDLPLEANLVPALLNVVPPQARAQSLPLSTFDPPFRPPRCGLSLA